MADLYKTLNKEVENDLAGNPPNLAKKLFLIFLIFAAAGAAVWLGVSAFSAAFGKTENQNAGARNQKSETAKVANNFSFAEIIKLPFAEEAELKKDESGKTNVLILGMSGEGYESPELTDTILLASLSENPAAEKQITLISLPRDLWVEIPGFGYFGKLNSLYLLGKKQTPENPFALISEKISEITGVTPQYSIAVDVSALARVVDSLDGINVWVEKDLYDPNFPTKNFGTEIFEVKKGWRYFDGETAAKYARSRHSQYGDFDRIKRQQQVLLALKNKAAGLNPIYDLPKFFALFETIKNNIAADLDLTEIKSLWNLSKDFGSRDLKGIVIDGDVSKNLIVSGASETPNGTASILYPSEGFEKYDRIREYILNSLNAKR